MRSTSAFTPSATERVLAVDWRWMPRPMPVRPLMRYSPRLSSGAISTSATSPSSTCAPPWVRERTMRRNSSGFVRRVSVRTVSSRWLLSMRPPGSSMFSRRIASSTSWTVMPRAASAWRSSQMRMEYLRSPWNSTCATPSTMASRSTKRRRASSVRSMLPKRSEVSATHRIGRLSPSTLATTGVSACSGRRESARETLSRTSLAAASTLRLRRNSSVTCDRSSRLCEEMVLIPSIPATAASISSVIWVSTTAAEAPE